jgi:hypothetical protein
VTIRFKNCRVAKLVKDGTKKKLFFSDGIETLVKRWNWCVEVEGDYIEK